jgi:uncharacterized small protein (DUF1192 family)
MFIVTQNDNSDARLAQLEQQVAELRAEIAALKADRQPTDRKAYMRAYMADRRAKARQDAKQ